MVLNYNLKPSIIFILKQNNDFITPLAMKL